MRKLFPIRAKNAVEALRALPRLLDADKLDEAAYETLAEALAQDPLNVDYHHAFGVLLQRMREAIEAADLPATDPRIRSYYELLAREEGEATVETHLAMLRHLCALGEVEEAERLTEALMLLHPAHPEVWKFRAVVEQGIEGMEAALAFPPTTTAKA